jgi:7-carboxy-7-deazaguanine synthase
MGEAPLRLVEHYVSTQGEGPRVGTLTQFVRFAGCNLKCPLWPCDSQFAIDPKLYREEMYQSWPNELSAVVNKKADETGARNICLTGGEPFLQNNDQLFKFIKGSHPAAQVLQWEVFTNGTFEIPDQFFAIGVKPVMDWKLPGSGEQTWINARSRNLQKMATYGGSVKFTITDETDFSTAFQVWESLVMDSGVEVFVGPAWGKVEPHWVADRIVEFKVPWRLNIQAHNYIYGAQTRGT